MVEADLALLREYKSAAAAEYKALKRTFSIDSVYCIDAETYWDDKFSLSKIATTEYVYSEQFKLFMFSVQKDTWAAPRIMSLAQFKQWAAGINWTRTGILAHHTQFDGLIAHKHFGVKPAAYFDTLSMARPIMPVSVGGSLDRLSKSFGFQGKQGSEVLVETKGKRTLTKAEYRQMASYAGVDAELCWGCFYKMLPHTLPAELRLINTTMKMYCQPRLFIEPGMVNILNEETKQGKLDDLAALAKQLKRDVSRKTIVSDKQFAQLMIDCGYDLPIKINKKTGKQAYALAKGDLAFKDLLKSKDPLLRQLVATRLGLKTSIVETRTTRMSDRSVWGPQPVYLNYWGAKTGRWSGGDKMNWQNFSRGTAMRKAVYAPATHKLIIADLAQIEARVNAYIAYQQDVIEAFRNREDVYCMAASKIYGRTITPADKNERFVGKVATLALGYGAGSARFADMLRLGSFGPPVDISDFDADNIVRAWRNANSRIVANWKTQENYLRSAFVGKQEIMDEYVTYQGFEGRGVTIMPDGTYIRYDGIHVEGRDISYCAKQRRLKDGTVREERQKLYGGLIVENNCQALSRGIIGDQIIRLEDAMPYSQVVLSTHDEVVLIVPNRYADRALKLTNEIMSLSPEWARDLPIAVEAHVSQRYDK